MKDTAVQDLGMWDDRKGQRRRPADLRAVAPQRIPLRGAVAVVVTLAVGVETPVPAGLAMLTVFSGPQVSLPPRAADSTPSCFHRWHREARTLKQQSCFQSGPSLGC